MRELSRFGAYWRCFACGKSERFRSYLIPFENLGEGLAVGKLPVMGVCSLEEAMEYVNASAQEQERMRRDAEDRWQSQAKGRMEKKKNAGLCIAVRNGGRQSALQ